MTNAGSEPTFSVTVDYAPTGVPVVIAVGELDIATAGDLRAVLLDPALPSPDLIVDLRGLTFIDSMGLSVLVASRREVAKQGGSVEIRCLRGPVTTILEVTKLIQVFAVVIDPDPGTARRPPA